MSKGTRIVIRKRRRPLRTGYICEQRGQEATCNTANSRDDSWHLHVSDVSFAREKQQLNARGSIISRHSQDSLIKKKTGSATELTLQRHNGQARSSSTFASVMKRGKRRRTGRPCDGRSFSTYSGGRAGHQTRTNKHLNHFPTVLVFLAQQPVFIVDIETCLSTHVARSKDRISRVFIGLTS